MHQTRPYSSKFHGPVRPGSAAVAILALLLAAPAMAQQKGQRTYASAEAASDALIKAVQENDDHEMARILGPDSRQILSSGDAAEDAQNRANFIRNYQDMHRLVKEPDGATILYVGARNWPTPIPITSHGKGWFFDTPAGRTEILSRRIGRNEYSTIRVCLELVAAQEEFHSSHDGHYARSIRSDNGQRNGLFWPAAEGEPRSPMGPLVAGAEIRDSGYPAGAATPYRGYYYRALTHQGKNAPGGARSYTDASGVTQGFAFLAFPAAYRSSGVMTFIVSKDGVVYERDLGPGTKARAQRMSGFDPGRSWKAVEGQQELAQ